MNSNSPHPKEEVHSIKGYSVMTSAERNLNSVTATENIVGNTIFAKNRNTDAQSWMRLNKKLLKNELIKHGWILLRGLNALSSTEFQQCVSTLDIQQMKEYGDLPMSPSQDGTSGVFNVTKYPPKNAILFHNEGAHTHQAPRYIFFQCSIAAPVGGETPLANSTQTYRALPDEIRSAFTDRGLLYRRNFIEGFDVSWQKYFGTSRHEVVESICAAQNVKVLWGSNGSLTTETYRPAVVLHPQNGSTAFFNQVLLHHPASLDPEVRLALNNLPLDGKLPREVYFGDGSPIPDGWVAEVLRAHINVAVSFQWQPGDIVMVDNYMVAHARSPYSGPRQHHVILGNSLS